MLYFKYRRIRSANGTVQGDPGWYGFDGIANRIAITNSSDAGNDVTVALDYRSLQYSELEDAGVDAIVSGVSMKVLGPNAASTWQNDRSATVSANQTVEGFIHLIGQPTLPNGDVYDSATMQPIGMLTLTIEDWTT